MTVHTNVISIFVSSQPGDSAILQGGLAIQILPSIRYLSGCLKHQFAAFIRDRQMLIVWNDEPEKIIEHATRIESQLMLTIWNDGTNYADEEKEAAPENINQVSLEELEAGLECEQPRQTMLLSPFIVAATLVLIMTSIGLGWRKLAIEVSVDGNYIRLAFVALGPIIFFVGLVSFSIIIYESELTCCSS